MATRTSPFSSHPSRMFDHMTKTNHFLLEACTDDRSQIREDQSIQQAMAFLLDAGITFEVLAFDRAA